MALATRIRRPLAPLRVAAKPFSRDPKGSVLFALILLSGCSSSGRMTEASRPIPEAARETFQTDIDGLALALPKVFATLGWAKLHLVNETVALHAAALIDDGRAVDIRAQKRSRGQVRLQVR